MSGQTEAGSRFLARCGRQARIWNRVSLALAVLLMIGIYRAATSVPYPTRRLPGGSTTGLVGVTYGEPRSMQVGSAWNRLQTAIISRGAKAAPRAELPGKGWPTVWLDHSQSYFMREWDRPMVVLRGAAGDEWAGEESTDFSNSSSQRWPGYLVGYEFPVFPRRERLLTLRVYQLRATQLWDIGTPWVEFAFPNPAFRSYPTWIPEALPAVRHNGDVAVALTSLRTGVEFPDGASPQKIGFFAATFATFRVSEQGKPSREWAPVEMTYEDATGNRTQTREDRLTWRGDEVGFPVYGQLPSDEACWKVRAKFARIHTIGNRKSLEFEFLAQPVRVH